MIGVDAIDDGALLTWSGGNDMRASRFDRDGRRSDAVSLEASTIGVVRLNGNWLFVSLRDGVLSGRTLDDAGRLSEPVELASPDVRFFDRFTVVSDGTSLLAVWVTYESEVRALRIDANGRASEPFTIGTAHPSASAMEAVALDDGFAVVWVTPGNSIESLRLIGDGSMSRTRLAQLETTLLALRAFADGNELVTVWARQNGLSEVTLLRDGEAPRVISNSVSLPYDVVKIGGTVYALLVAQGAMTAALVSEDGTRRRRWRFEGEVASARIASFGDRALLAVSITAADRYSRDLLTIVVDSRLEEVRGGERMNADPPAQQHPAIARGANGESLAAWAETFGNDAVSLLSARLGADGRIIGEPVKLASLQRPDASIAVASDGIDYLVVWHDARGLLTRRVQRDGMPVGQAVRLPNESSGEVCGVAWNGSEYIVGWLQRSEGDRHLTGWVHAITLSRDGTFGSNERFTDGFLEAGDCACAAGESSMLFVWKAIDGLHGVVRTHGGSAGGTFPLARGTFPAVAANGKSFAVAWTTYDGRTVERAIVSEHGTVSPVHEAPLRDVDMRDLQTRPIALAPFRDGYLLAWGTNNLYALALHANGQSAGSVTLAASDELEGEPAIAGGDVPVVIYTRGKFVSRPTGSDLRAFTRTITSAPQPPRRRSARH